MVPRRPVIVGRGVRSSGERERQGEKIQMYNQVLSLTPQIVKLEHSPGEVLPNRVVLTDQRVTVQDTIIRVDGLHTNVEPSRSNRIINLLPIFHPPPLCHRGYYPFTFGKI